MPLALLVACTLQAGVPHKQEFPSLFSEQKHFLITYAPVEPISHKCPKYGWEFSVKVEAHGFVWTTQKQELRFRVYAQSHKYVSLAQDTAKVLLLCRDLLTQKINFDNPMRYSYLVDVFLCEGGSPGGEQGIFTGEDEFGYRTNRNTIYIYNLDSFSDPIERLREVAHEYGHATLPPIKGFETPEEFGNGYLGEKLFLFWIFQSDEIIKLLPASFSSEKQNQLKWVDENVVNLVDNIWLNGINLKTLQSKGKEAMNEYIGLMLFAEQTFPPVFSRALRLARDYTAIGAYNGLKDALNEKSSWEIHVPEKFTQKNVWIPFSQQWQIEGASIVKPESDRVQIKPSRKIITVRKKS